MKKITSKSNLAILLSRIEGFHEPKVRDEQYLMDSEIGASVLWSACLIGDIEEKVICDLGCGTGMLGIGALLLGSKSSLFVDFDEKALQTAKRNVLKLQSEGYFLGEVSFMLQEVRKIDIHADLVIQNPPFGTKKRHEDVVFLRKAMEIAPIVYSFHKSETKGFIRKFSSDRGFRITHSWDFRFPIKASLKFHIRDIKRIGVTCFRLIKNTHTKYESAAKDF